MSENLSLKSHKRKHSNENKHKKSKKSKSFKNNSNKNIKDDETFENQLSILLEDDNNNIDSVNNLESEIRKRNEKINEMIVKKSALQSDERSAQCPYLDTIDRNVLDFDFEKLCCVSLSHLNVYACLICGKYFQGRGTNTHANTHSVDLDHHVFLNLETRKFFCLPDNYQIVNNSLDDIIYLLNPTFSAEQIEFLDRETSLIMAYNGSTYYPGIVGVNNIKANDYCNVVIQLLSHISPIRDYFLKIEEQNLTFTVGNLNSILVQRFGELIRKLWNPRNFKTHVSPHEFLQAVVLCSRKKFQFTVQSNAVDFLSWLINTLHGSMKGKGKVSTVFSKAFQGKMLVHSRKVIPVELSEENKRRCAQLDEFKKTEEEVKFFYLTCDFPSPPLFKDEMHSTVIPQVPLTTLLNKFNGFSEREYKTHKDSYMKTFEIQKLPPYLTLYFKRFIENYIRKEKYPTIVTFDIATLDLADLLLPKYRKTHKFTTYDLIGNVVHDGTIEPGAGVYKVHINHESTGKWYCMQDLHVDEVISEMIPLGESVLQIWKLNTSVVNQYYEGPNK